MNFKKLLDEVDPEIKSNYEIVGGFKAYIGDNVVTVCSVLDEKSALVHPVGKDTQRVVIGLQVMDVLKKDIAWSPKTNKSFLSKLIAA